jgi:hypothetical protein
MTGSSDVEKLALRMRLDTLLALVPMLDLAINIARLLAEAGSRVRAEDHQSVVRRMLLGHGVDFRGTYSPK